MSTIYTLKVVKLSTKPDLHAYDPDGYTVIGKTTELPRKGSIFSMWRPVGETGKPITHSENSSWNTTAVEKAENGEKGGTFVTEDCTYSYEILGAENVVEEKSEDIPEVQEPPVE